MKLTKLLFGIAVTTFMFTACSNNEPDIPDVSDTIDYDYLNSLTRGTASTGYELKGWGVESSGSSNIMEKDPNSLPYSKIFFLNGKASLELKLTSIIQNYHPILYPLELYRVQTGFDSNHVILAHVKVKENNKITINDKEYEILSLTEDGIKLLYRDKDSSSDFINYTIEYKKLDLNYTKTDKFLYFDSRTEALLDIVRMLRARYGDTVDVTPCFDSHYGLSEPVFNLKKIEENILAGNDWNMQGVCSAAK